MSRSIRLPRLATTNQLSRTGAKTRYGRTLSALTAVPVWALGGIPGAEAGAAACADASAGTASAPKVSIVRLHLSRFITREI